MGYSIALHQPGRGHHCSGRGLIGPGTHVNSTCANHTIGVDARSLLGAREISAAIIREDNDRADFLIAPNNRSIVHQAGNPTCKLKQFAKLVQCNQGGTDITETLRFCKKL